MSSAVRLTVSGDFNSLQAVERYRGGRSGEEVPKTKMIG